MIFSCPQCGTDLEDYGDGWGYCPECCEDFPITLHTHGDPDEL